MSTDKIIHIHLGGTDETLSCKLQENLTLAAVAQLVMETGKLGEGRIEEIFFFEEDSDDELPSGHHFNHGHHGKRIHAHRCRKVDVTFLYTDQKREHSFRAGATVGKLLDWAKHAFGGDQNGKYALRLSAEGEPLAHAVHVGSLVKPGHCSVTLYFAPTCRIQG
jgi:hypothetical protein